MQRSVIAATLCTQFVHIHLLICMTGDLADYVSHVKTVMAVPIGGHFKAGSFRILISESQQLRALSAAAECGIQIDSM